MNKIIIKETQPIAINRSLSGTSLTPSVEYPAGWHDVTLLVESLPYVSILGVQLPQFKTYVATLEARYTGDNLPSELTLVLENLDGTGVEVSGLKLSGIEDLEDESRLVTYEARAGEYTIKEWARGQ